MTVLTFWCPPRQLTLLNGHAARVLAQNSVWTFVVGRVQHLSAEHSTRLTAHGEQRLRSLLPSVFRAVHHCL
ncbi:hypothetical protein Y032_0077g1081 [Ancylostoma ceylanicum]|uniref:Uncharacterized protein n=1 Tax=Ancylostoma ceylanicum TaxID=53326 RepID=A0A016TT37_9BILA|nr:hypothetical protein Y032_0077g1081 [Ancylostoma ceylanicum]